MSTQPLSHEDLAAQLLAAAPDDETRANLANTWIGEYWRGYNAASAATEALRQTADLIGGYQATIYKTVLGEFWRIATIHGAAIKLLGPQEEPCVHFLTAEEGRQVAAVLVRLADEMDAANPATDLT